MSATNSIRWDEDDVRDVKAVWQGFNLRVKAENRGTVWVITINGPGTDYRSEHTSKDSAKQKAAKVVREAKKTIQGTNTL